jgi:hypothetical protein
MRSAKNSCNPTQAKASSSNQRAKARIIHNLSWGKPLSGSRLAWL